MIKIAIIGTGGIAKTHLESFLQFPERCEVTAMVDIYPEKITMLCDQFGLDVKAYHDYQEVLRIVKSTLFRFVPPLILMRRLPSPV